MHLNIKPHCESSLLKNLVFPRRLEIRLPVRGLERCPACHPFASLRAGCERRISPSVPQASLPCPRRCNVILSEAKDLSVRRARPKARHARLFSARTSTPLPRYRFQHRGHLRRLRLAALRQGHTTNRRWAQKGNPSTGIKRSLAELSHHSRNK